MKIRLCVLLTVLAGAVSVGGRAAAQSVVSSSPNAGAAASKGDTAAAVAPPVGYIIGPEDVLSIVFWREKEMSSDVVVRPDGRISLPLVNEVVAAGLTPEQLREKITTAAGQYIEEPNVTVVVKQINSRKVFIIGLVGRPGTYPLTDRMNIVQLLALAGGLSDFADKENIIVMRAERRPDGLPLTFKFSYAQMLKRLNLLQNIELKPGDTVIVP